MDDVKKSVTNAKKLVEKLNEQIALEASTDCAKFASKDYAKFTKDSEMWLSQFANDKNCEWKLKKAVAFAKDMAA